MRSVLLGALVALATMPAHAAEDTDSANYLLPYCKLTPDQLSTNPINALIWTRCVGIIEGSGEMFSMLRDGALQGRLPVLCLDVPNGVTTGQVTKVVVRYGELHPDQTHKRFWSFVLDAVHDAWPCKKQPSNRP